ncbi:MAG: asparagine synthase-related protein [Ruminococcus flavefaciens]|nr:asparagine synthase-related protein [Ruminococcus flavefaciens]
MREDKIYCMSSFLMYRTVIDRTRCFSTKYNPFYVYSSSVRYPVYNEDDLLNILEKQCKKAVKNKKVALALSSGIDSAILAKLLPKGTMTYTLKCISNGIGQIDETKKAAEFAHICGHENKVIKITWEDMIKYSMPLMKHKGAPIHSIEVQIYKAAIQAKKNGMDALMFGESADVLYGGMSKLLMKDWTLGEFINRYSYVLPYYVLKKFNMILEPYINCVKDGFVDVHKFNSTVFYQEAINSYHNACATAEIECLMPYSNTIMKVPLDYELIRAGESKYYVRNVFRKLYRDMEILPKLSMPRPMDIWLADWKGPIRTEFWENCAINMTGEQKWLIWILEKFMNICDSREEE